METSQNPSVVINRLALIEFFDNAPDESRGHATSIVAVAGEELGLALLVDYFARNGLAAQVLPGPCTMGKQAGHRLDGWVEAGDTLFQVEVKNWSAHSIGGKRVPVSESDDDLSAFRVDRWNSVWRDGQLVDRPARKVLERMTPRLAHSRIRPLIVFWVPMHPTGGSEALFTAEPSTGDFDELFVFSLSNYLRSLSEDSLALAMPQTLARMRWLERLFELPVHA